VFALTAGSGPKDEDEHCPYRLQSCKKELWTMGLPLALALALPLPYSAKH